MPPRIPFQPKRLRLCTSNARFPTCQCRQGSMITAPALSHDQSLQSAPPIMRHAPTQPPSYKPPEFRKSQLHRQYQSLLRSSPLMLMFQHNNLKANEWSAIRRELATALTKVDADQNLQDPVGHVTRLQVVQTGIFASALRVVEFFKPQPPPPASPSSDDHSAITQQNSILDHGLSKKAHRVSKNSKSRHGLEPLLSGPIMVVAFPSVSPAHLAATLSLLAPNEKFPAPRRRQNPELYGPVTQSGLQKLLLLGARVEGKAFDMEGARWVGGIEGGLDGLRAQLVGMLTSFGGSLTSALDAAGRSLYITLEGRKGVMEEEEKGGSDGGEKKEGDSAEAN